MQMKWKKQLQALAGIGLATTLAGCGGGSSSNDSGTRQFTGNYSGYFAGVTTSDASPVSGDFSATVANSGALTGTVSQPGLPNFPATGTINRFGELNATANGSVPTVPPTNFVSTLVGTASRDAGDSIASGILSTTQNGNSAVFGRFVAVRNTSKASPFAGNYAGAFTGTGQSGNSIGGTFTATVTANGALRGTVTQIGLGTYPAIGAISRSGDVEIFAVTGLPTSPVTVIVSTLTGRAILTGGVVSATGDFDTTAGGQPNASGTFTAVRNG